MHADSQAGICVAQLLVVLRQVRHVTNISMLIIVICYRLKQLSDQLELHFVLSDLLLVKLASDIDLCVSIRVCLLWYDEIER